VSTDLRPPIFHVALVQPEIPYNTGNIARLCVATQCRLHIVGKAAFSLEDRDVRRAGLYFWPYLELCTWRDLAELAAATPGRRRWLFSRSGKRSYTEVAFAPGDVLVFGRESTGLKGLVPEVELADALAIPLLGPARSLNVSNAVAGVVLEGLRQLRARGIALPEQAEVEGQDDRESFDMRPG
jgi:tRNA (cytidine/uridine-2'-O-)-methyltransferase